MSFNSNTIYPAVDINTIANQCKEAINANPKCFVVVDYVGSIYGIYRCRNEAQTYCSLLNENNEDDYWSVVLYDLQ